MNQDRPSMADPAIDDVQYAFRCTWPARLALNTLEGELPGRIGEPTGLREALRALRSRLEEQELAEIRDLGSREYLLIKPLAPDVGGELADKAAELVRGLDDLGLIVRLD